VLEASGLRVEPRCAVFDMCGGCSLQHMSSESQIAHKQQTLVEQLAHNGVLCDHIIDPLTGPEYGYRHKARLGVRFVPKKDKVLVGFRERNSSFITETERCEVLHPSVGSIIGAMAECINLLAAKRQIPQIEVAVGDDRTVLVFRHLVELGAADRAILKDFCEQHGLVAYLQAGKPDALELLTAGEEQPLYYELSMADDDAIRIEFQPSDFTQVNPGINRDMVRNAVEYLDLEPTDKVLDLFSGLGNFSLAMARHCDSVTAVEGSLSMVRKARHNAEINVIGNCEFIYADLYGDQLQAEPWLKQNYDKVLLDPPRSGAQAIIPYLGKMRAKTVVYVSCHPATLARDAAVLVNELGYRLEKAGVMNMFPHTAHVESIAVFHAPG
jgi:23S rRNA (uracil1939-C5)-methyltransferase